MVVRHGFYDIIIKVEVLFLNSRIKIKFSLFSAKGESCFLPLVRLQIYDMV